MCLIHLFRRQQPSVVAYEKPPTQPSGRLRASTLRLALSDDCPCGAASGCTAAQSCGRDSAGHAVLSSCSCGGGLAEHDATRVLPHLIVGGNGLATDLRAMRRAGVTAVVNCTLSQPNLFPGDLAYANLRVPDSPCADVSGAFDDAVEFIEDARKGGGTCLVHCGLGVSRSAAVALAYLVRARGMALVNALELLKSKRPQASPNVGFMAQLLAYELRVTAACTLDLRRYCADRTLDAHSLRLTSTPTPHALPAAGGAAASPACTAAMAATDAVACGRGGGGCSAGGCGGTAFGRARAWDEHCGALKEQQVELEVEGGGRAARLTLAGDNGDAAAWAPAEGAVAWGQSPCGWPAAAAPFANVPMHSSSAKVAGSATAPPATIRRSRSEGAASGAALPRRALRLWLRSW